MDPLPPLSPHSPPLPSRLRSPLPSNYVNRRNAPLLSLSLLYLSLSLSLSLCRKLPLIPLRNAAAVVLLARVAVVVVVVVTWVGATV